MSHPYGLSCWQILAFLCLLRTSLSSSTEVTPLKVCATHFRGRRIIRNNCKELRNSSLGQANSNERQLGAFTVWLFQVPVSSRKNKAWQKHLHIKNMILIAPFDHIRTAESTSKYRQQCIRFLKILQTYTHTEYGMIARLVDWFRWRLGPKASINLPLAPWVPTKDSGTTHTSYDLESPTL